METAGQGAYKRWKRVQVWEDGYERLWNSTNDPETSTTTNHSDVLSTRGIIDQSKVIYLTADSTDELDQLHEGETYIIGGIVDRNRYKNLCLEKGQKQGIRTARLPIGKYLAELTTRKVLTVNQVFDILLHWVDKRDWESAIRDVVPKRKMKDQKTQQAVRLAIDGDTIEGKIESLIHEDDCEDVTGCVGDLDPAEAMNINSANGN